MEVKCNMQLLCRNILNIGIPAYSSVTRSGTSEPVEPSTITATDDVEDEPDNTYRYSLSERPKTFNQLWVEYDIGIGGRAPAKTFSTN